MFTKNAGYSTAAIMKLSIDIPLLAFRSYIYIVITIFTILFILFPASLLSYWHFQSIIIPKPSIPIPLQFQYLSDNGLFAISTINEDLSNVIVNCWNNANVNQFTKIEQVFSIHLRYIKLKKDSEIGGLRISVFNDSMTPVLKADGNTEGWPFRPISIYDNTKQTNIGSQFHGKEFSLYKNDKRFTSWNQIIGKSYMKSIPLIDNESVEIDDEILQYFMPGWMLTLFVPRGIQKLLSIKNILWVLRRNKYDNKDLIKNNKYLQTVDLLNSYGDFNNLKTQTFSTGFIVFEGKLKKNEILGTNILVELDKSLKDIFIVESYVTFEYVLQGLRWWVYWWPGLCFMIGVSIIWFFSCVGCVIMSWFGLSIMRMLWNSFMNKQENEERLVGNQKVIKRNLDTLLNS